MAKILGFGGKLKRLRKQKHMRQIDVAKALDISLRAYSRYECDNIIPKNPEIVARMAELFGVDKTFLTVFSPANMDSEILYRPVDPSSSETEKAQRLARDLLMQLELLFEGGQLGKYFEDEFAMAFTQIYFRAKMKENKKEQMTNKKEDNAE